MNAAVVGLSQVLYKGHGMWELFELFFFLFYSSEFIIRIKIYGCYYCWNGPDWPWYVFDFCCIESSMFDMFMTHLGGLLFGNSFDMGSGLQLIKMARLAR